MIEQKKSIRSLVQLLAGRWVFVILLMGAVFGVGWMIWQAVAQPLLQEAGVPAGISSQLPSLNKAVVQAVEEQRAARANHTLRDYSRFLPLFPTPIITPNASQP